jgi:hypothetical protein
VAGPRTFQPIEGGLVAEGIAMLGSRDKRLQPALNVGAGQHHPVATRRTAEADVGADAHD